MEIMQEHHVIGAYEKYLLLGDITLYDFYWSCLGWLMYSTWNNPGERLKSEAVKHPQLVNSKVE